MERFEQHGQFMIRNGLAKDRGMKTQCRKKVCFVSTDQSFLQETLFGISSDNDCFEVRFTLNPRHGAYMGICRFTNESSVGDLWAKFESHPKTWVTIQDDEFCETYRSKIRNY